MESVADEKGPQFLKGLKKEVDDNLTNSQFGVEELANSVGLSRSQLHRRLNSISGKSVSQFIREHRLQRGMELLKAGELTAADVADRVGFGSATYFSKCFNDYYGFPPGEAKHRTLSSDVTESAAPDSRNETGRRSRMLRTIVVVSAIVLAAAATYFLIRQQTSLQKLADKSVAILPFKNLGTDEQNVYFSDGVIEAIRTNLSQIGELRVISRTSTEQYRESTKSAKEICRDLGVATLLEGSVQRDNNKVRVEVRLIDGTSQGLMWSRTYDRVMKDVFAIQSEIAGHVASELNAKLSPEETARIMATGTQNAEAYDLYLKGIYEYRTYTNKGVHQSIKYLRQAIALDSGYALPYAVLANSYIALASIFGAEMNALEALDLGKPLIDKALSLDPNLEEAHFTMGFYLLYHDWDFQGAEVSYLRAIRQDHPDALALYADFLNFVGRHKEALTVAERLNAKHPYYPNTRMILSYVYNDQLDEALEFSETRMKLFHNYYALDGHGFLLLNMKRYSDAIPFFVRAMALEGIRYPRMMGWMGAAYAKSGNTVKAMEVIGELKLRWSNGENGSIAFFIAVVYAAMGETEAALSWLKTAYDKHEMEMPWLMTEPQLYDLHDNETFQALARSMRFPQAQ
jgi:TolB-like protein/AraC-like DNA-binding protein